MDMLERLQQYYEDKGIAAKKFNCPYYRECKANCSEFTKATEAFVSRGYQYHKLPRLLFISLDSGSGHRWSRYRDLFAIRKRVEDSDLPEGKHKHWYRTYELALTLLKKPFEERFRTTMHIERVKHYFAHTNSAKCSMNRDGRRKADPRLFRNCRGFIPDEVRILNPDVLVTQGDEARNSIIAGSFEELRPSRYISTRHWKRSEFPEIKILSINNSPVLWIHTYHPRCWGKFNRCRREKFERYSEIVHEFVQSRG